MSVDGTPQRVKGPELDDMIGRGFMGLMCASMLMNPGTMFTAMNNTIAPGVGIDAGVSGTGLTRMMGGFSNTLNGFVPLMGEAMAVNTVMRMTDPAQQRRQVPGTVPTPSGPS